MYLIRIIGHIEACIFFISSEHQNILTCFVTLNTEVVFQFKILYHIIQIIVSKLQIKPKYQIIFRKHQFCWPLGQLQYWLTVKHTFCHVPEFIQFWFIIHYAPVICFMTTLIKNHYQTQHKFTTSVFNGNKLIKVCITSFTMSCKMCFAMLIEMSSSYSEFMLIEMLILIINKPKNEFAQWSL